MPATVWTDSIRRRFGGKYLAVRLTPGRAAGIEAATMSTGDSGNMWCPAFRTAANRLCGGGSAAAQLGESAVARSGRLPWDTSSVRLPWHTSSLPWHTSSREGRGGARQEMNLLLLHRRVPSGCGSPTWLALPRHELRTPSYTGRRLGGRGGRGTNLWGAFGSWTFVMFARKPVSSIDHQPARPAAAGALCVMGVMKSCSANRV